MPVVDAHHHLLDPARFRYPWLGPDLVALDRRFGPEDLAPSLARAGVDATVLVQTLSDVDETRAFLSIAAATPWIAGVVGWVDLTTPDVGDAIADLCSGPGGERLVGIRHQVHDEPDPDWLGRPDVTRGLEAVAGAGFAFDLLVRTRELPAALAAIDRHPDLRFVVDHLAKPPITAGDLGAWTRALRPLGERPNVWAKLSGLVTEADWSAWRPADLAPATETALAVFGPERLLFGSDWPVCLVAASYEDVLGAARALTSGLTPSERSAVFGGTAAHVYRILSA